MRLLLILGILIFSLTACDKQSNNILEIDGVQIRLVNISNQDFENVQVYDSTAPVVYGNIGAGEITPYKQFELAYNYIHPTLMVNGNELSGGGWCPVGELPLEDGFYTFEVSINNGYVYAAKVVD